MTVSKESPFPAIKVSADGVTLCRGCSQSGACQLGVMQTDVHNGMQTITSSAECPPEWEGGPGVAHGGWIAGVFDEVLGTLPCRLDVPCVTASLVVEFLKPVPIARAVTVSGRVESHLGRRWCVTGTMRLVGDERDLARATAHLVEPAPDHFTKVR